MTSSTPSHAHRHHYYQHLAMHRPSSPQQHTVFCGRRKKKVYIAQIIRAWIS
jgi:hypothetical protein